MIFDKAINRIRNETFPRTITLQTPEDWTVADMTVTTSQSAAMKLSAVNACVEVITNSVSKLPVYLMNSNSKERITKHPIVKLLAERPNEAMTPSVFKKLVESNRLLGGNGYAIVIRDSRSAQPRELIPVNHQYITPYIDDNGKLWYVFRHPKTGEVRKLDNFDILHYKAYSEDGLTGISVLQRASETISVATAAQTYENKFYTQNARPTGVLKVNDKLEPAAKTKIKDEWRSIHEGVDNSFKIAVLDLGLEFQPISISNKDSQFIESKAVSVEDIARFFGVPLYKINSGKQSYSSNEQNGIEYVVNTLHPVVTQYEEEDTYKLLFDRERVTGLEIRRNMMAELRGDTASRGTWYKTMREVGAFSPDDILALEDMPKVQGGDTRYASLNYVPLEDFKELSKNRNGGER
nr:phage portal protein [Sedimentibacter sp.]